MSILCPVIAWIWEGSVLKSDIQYLLIAAYNSVKVVKLSRGNFQLPRGDARGTFVLREKYIERCMPGSKDHWPLNQRLCQWMLNIHWQSSCHRTEIVPSTPSRSVLPLTADAKILNIDTSFPSFVSQ